MQVIRIKVTQTEVTITEKPEKITAENYNQIKCIFDLDEAFDDLIVRASFNGEFVTVEQGECFAPALKEGNCKLGVYGYTVVDEKLKLRISPSPKIFYVDEGSYNENDVESDQPLPTELEQHYSNIKELVESGKLKGDTGEKGEKGDKGDKGDTGETGATGPQGPPGKDAVTDTELSVDSNNAIANSAVAKVLDNGKCRGIFCVNAEDATDIFSKYRGNSGTSPLADGEYILLCCEESWYNGSDHLRGGIYIIPNRNGDTQVIAVSEKAVNEMLTAITKYLNEFDKSLDEIDANLNNKLQEYNKLNSALYQTAVDTADEALTIAKGRNRALTFLTYQELSSWIDGDFTRSDGKTVSDLMTGDNLYIVETGVPDYWWDGTQIRLLETQKVDLSEYAEKDYVDEEIAEQVAVPNSDIANYLEVADAIGLWKTVTAGITSFDNMFQGRTDITKIPELDMSSGTTARYMCNGCTNLKSFVNSTTGNVTSLYHAFRDCTSAEIIEIDTSKNTQFNGTFWGCSSLKELVIDMSRAQGMDYMCRNCSSLVSIKTLDFTGGSASASGKNYSNMFTGCPSLVHVEIVPGTIKGNLSFVNSPNLDFDSVASIFAGLADMSDYDTHTLTLHANVQITQAQADGAVAKNWNIVGGTVNG